MSTGNPTTDGKQQLLLKQATERRYADRGSRPLQTLSPGETVRIQRGKQLVQGRVLEELRGAPRTYRVVTTDGQELRRNRLHLHQTLEKTPHINITAHEESLATAIQQAGQAVSTSPGDRPSSGVPSHAEEQSGPGAAKALQFPVAASS